MDYTLVDDFERSANDGDLLLPKGSCVRNASVSFSCDDPCEEHNILQEDTCVSRCPVHQTWQNSQCVDMCGGDLVFEDGKCVLRKSYMYVAIGLVIVLVLLRMLQKK